MAGPTYEELIKNGFKDLTAEQKKAPTNVRPDGGSAPIESPSMLGVVGREALRGASKGWSDELGASMAGMSFGDVLNANAAAVSPAMSSFRPPGPTPEVLESDLKRRREQQKADVKAYPKVAGVSDFVGDMGLNILLAPFTGGQSLNPIVTGALRGAGEGEGTQGKLIGGAVGGALGGVAGRIAKHSPIGAAGLGVGLSEGLNAVTGASPEEKTKARTQSVLGVGTALGSKIAQWAGKWAGGKRDSAIRDLAGNIMAEDAAQDSARAQEIARMQAEQVKAEAKAASDRAKASAKMDREMAVSKEAFLKEHDTKADYNRKVQADYEKALEDAAKLKFKEAKQAEKVQAGQADDFETALKGEGKRVREAFGGLKKKVEHEGKVRMQAGRDSGRAFGAALKAQGYFDQGQAGSAPEGSLVDPDQQALGILGNIVKEVLQGARFEDTLKQYGIKLTPEVRKGFEVAMADYGEKVTATAADLGKKGKAGKLAEIKAEQSSKTAAKPRASSASPAPNTEPSPPDPDILAQHRLSAPGPLDYVTDERISQLAGDEHYGTLRPITREKLQGELPADDLDLVTKTRAQRLMDRVLGRVSDPDKTPVPNVHAALSRMRPNEVDPAMFDLTEPGFGKDKPNFFNNMEKEQVVANKQYAEEFGWGDQYPHPDDTQLNLPYPSGRAEDMSGVPYEDVLASKYRMLSPEEINDIKVRTGMKDLMEKFYRRPTQAESEMAEQAYFNREPISPKPAPKPDVDTLLSLTDEQGNYNAPPGWTVPDDAPPPPPIAPLVEPQRAPLANRVSERLQAAQGRSANEFRKVAGKVVRHPANFLGDVLEGGLSKAANMDPEVRANIWNAFAVALNSSKKMDAATAAILATESISGLEELLKRDPDLRTRMEAALRDAL